MPSGAKKRKAAKKKKEQQGNHTNKGSGIDDSKSQDERESDTGGLDSPASLDPQNHQLPFGKGSGESKTTDPSTVRSIDTQNKSKEKVATKKVGQEDSGSESTSSTMHVQFVKKSLDGSSSCASSSGSSSDEDSQVVEKTVKEAANDSAVKATSHNGEHKAVDSFPKEVISGPEKASSDKAENSVVKAAPVVDSVKPLVTVPEEVIRVKESDSVENSRVADVIESRLKENEELKTKENKLSPLSKESIGTSNVVESVANGNSGMVLPVSGGPGAENIRDSKIHESPEKQPLLPSAPQVAQRTSWLSCCGLFDVLSGSSR